MTNPSLAHHRLPGAQLRARLDVGPAQAGRCASDHLDALDDLVWTSALARACGFAVRHARTRSRLTDVGLWADLAAAAPQTTSCRLVAVLTEPGDAATSAVCGALEGRGPVAQPGVSDLAAQGAIDGGERSASPVDARTHRRYSVHTGHRAIDV